MTPNYNHLAWIYDVLANIVFGRKQELAKQAFLSQIPINAKILVVGGGTGKIIDYLRSLNKELEVDFVEPSANMILRAKKRDTSSFKINFYRSSILDITSSGYDAVLTNFFFDQFTLDQSRIILQNIKFKLKPTGILIFSDFVKSDHIWDKIVVSIMFIFFRLTAKISATAFPPYDYLFSSLGFESKSSIKISRNIIAASYSLLQPN